MRTSYVEAVARLVTTMPDEAVVRGLRAGLLEVNFSCRALGRMAGVGHATAWRWLRGQPIGAERERKLRAALGLLDVEPPQPKRQRIARAA